MIAMQYTFVLPADYDMEIIDRRVREKGHALDGHAPLTLKAYGVSRVNDIAGSRENQYAPFYLWKDAEAMRDFLCSPGFAGLVASFGWPVVQHWPLMLAHRMAPTALRARHGVKTTTSIPKFTNLADLCQQEGRRADEAVVAGAVVAVAALDPASWCLVRYQAWTQRLDDLVTEGEAVQAYEILHVSAPDIPG